MTSQQPFVHDRCVLLSAPNQWWSSRTGDSVSGVDGIYVGDVRVVGSIVVTVSGGELEWVGNGVEDDDASRIRHHHVVRVPGGGADPLVSLTRERSVSASAATERYEVRNASDSDIELVLHVGLEGEASPVDGVKSGSAATPAPVGDGLRAEGAEVSVSGTRAVLRWAAGIPAGASWDVGWSLPLPAAGQMAAPAGPPLVVPPADGRVGRLLRRSIADLNGLRMTDTRMPGSMFFAAGAPWFFTLFGRDSLIAALMALPFSLDVAVGTLRSLAARQGTRHDVATAEQPGKILHEVRSNGFALQGNHRLPPVYFGSIDATLLWILLLREVLATGTAASKLADLRDPLKAASRWLLECSDADGDGLLEYIDDSGQGLVNQGWKDSGDSIRFADGSLGEAPIALAEVQGYAYEAALAAIEVAAALGADVDVVALQAFARRVREQFRARFWCTDDLGDYPALALDGAKRPVDGVASNMGYLVGSGMLTKGQEEVVVARLLDPSMFSGFGVRTLSTTNVAYWPLRYHGGSVWTHDTAQIIWCLQRAGFRHEARVLAEGLLDAAEQFQFRLPELFAGHPRSVAPQALPYPASCRPQAWAAAAGVVVWRALESSADEVT